MPSSLTEVLPSTSVCSTCPPVSVCGTVAPRPWACALASGFSRQCGINPSGLGSPPRLPLASRSTAPWICLRCLPTGLEGRETPGPTPLRPRVTPGLAPNGRGRDGTLRPLSIACASRPRLRPASPAADQHGCGTLGHSVGGIRTPLALLMPTFALPAPPRSLPLPLRRRRGRSPTTCRAGCHPRVQRTSAASVPGLAPVDCRCRGTPPRRRVIDQ